MSIIIIKLLPEIIDQVWSNLDPNPSLFKKFFRYIYLGLMIIVGILSEYRIVYYIAFTVAAFMGVFWHPFWFSFMLTEVTRRSATLKNSIRAIWDPRKQLVLILALFVLIGYYFALTGYIFYAPKFIADAENSIICCDSMVRCLVCIIDTTFKQDSGIGSFLYENNMQSASSFNYSQFIYENLVLILMVVILLELLSGTIIDTFGALRERDAIRLNDVEGSCFICGLGVEAFEKVGCVDFKTHIKKEHYLWDYINFLAHL